MRIHWIYDDAEISELREWPRSSKSALLNTPCTGAPGRPLRTVKIPVAMADSFMGLICMGLVWLVQIHCRAPFSFQQSTR